MKKVKLGDIATIYNGNSINKAVKKEKYMKDVPGWNYIGTKDVGFDGNITYNTGVIIPYSENGFRLAPSGSVFVCSEGGSAGKKTAIVKEEVCFGNKLFAIVNEKKLFNEKYIYYYTRYEKFREQFKILATSLMGGISAKNFSKIEIPLCDLDEQEHIVSKIEELFSELDAGVETLKKTEEKLSRYRQAVLETSFSLNDIKKVELGSIIEKPRYGSSKKCDYKNDDNSTMVYRIPNIDIGTGYISKDDIKYANFDVDELEGLDLNENDLLLIRSNGSRSLVGRTALIRKCDTNATFAGYLIRLRLLDSSYISAKYLYYYLESHSARLYIEKTAKSTSGVNNINAEEIKKIELPWCDKNRQTEIVKIIDEKLSACSSIEETIDNALRQAEAMRQSILKEAFEGRL